MKKLLATTIIIGMAASFPLQAFAQSAPSLPEMGEKISFDKYDSVMADLEAGIKSRSEALSYVEEEKPSEGLPKEARAEISDVEKMARAQREIAVMKAELERLKVAKELWQEIHTETVPELQRKLEAQKTEFENRIEDLETQLVNVTAERDEYEQKFRDVEMQIEAANRERDNYKMQVERLREEVSIQRDTIANLERERDELRFSNQSNPMQSDNSFVAAPLILPEVMTIRSVGRKKTAKIYIPGAGTRTVRVGQVIMNDLTIVEISEHSVIASEGRDEFELPYHIPMGDVVVTTDSVMPTPNISLDEANEYNELFEAAN